MDLNNIRYLLEAVDGGSFSAAARALGVPPSLVSRKIARLESEVGARLFQRTTRSLQLTDAGQVFLGHARSGLQSFELAKELTGDISGAPSGRVRLSAPAGLADALWPVLSRFMSLFPSIRLEIDLTDRFVDLVEERIDLAVRSGPHRRFEKLIGRRLVDAPRRLFASPGYLREHGAPRVVGDLKRHACVVLGTHADRVTWTIEIGRRSQNVIVDGRIAVNEATMAAACAADGFGIAFLPLAVCARLVAAGRLQRVLQRASGGETGLWLVYPDRHLSTASRILADFLIAETPTSFSKGAAIPGAALAL